MPTKTTTSSPSISRRSSFVMGDNQTEEEFKKALLQRASYSTIQRRDSTRVFGDQSQSHEGNRNNNNNNNSGNLTTSPVVASAAAGATLTCSNPNSRLNSRKTSNVIFLPSLPSTQRQHSVTTNPLAPETAKQKIKRDESDINGDDVPETEIQPIDDDADVINNNKQNEIKNENASSKPSRPHLDARQLTVSIIDDFEVENNNNNNKESGPSSATKQSIDGQTPTSRKPVITSHQVISTTHSLNARSLPSMTKERASFAVNHSNHLYRFHHRKNFGVNKSMLSNYILDETKDKRHKKHNLNVAAARQLRDQNQTQMTANDNNINDDHHQDVSLSLVLTSPTSANAGQTHIPAFIIVGDDNAGEFDLGERSSSGSSASFQSDEEELAEITRGINDFIVDERTLRKMKATQHAVHGEDENNKSSNINPLNGENFSSFEKKNDEGAQKQREHLKKQQQQELEQQKRGSFLYKLSLPPLYAISLHFSSLYIFPPHLPSRVIAYNLTRHNIFEIIIILLITTNCVFLALDDPLEPTPAPYQAVAEIFFASAFTVEMIIKVFATGFARHRGAYLRDAWNVLDFVIVLLGWLNMSPEFGNFTALRSLRVLRALRSVHAVPELKRLVRSLISSITELSRIAVLTVLILFVCGIFGVQILGGAYRFHCIKNEALAYLPTSAPAIVPGMNTTTSTIAATTITTQDPLALAFDITNRNIRSVPSWNDIVRAGCNPSAAANDDSFNYWGVGCPVNSTCYEIGNVYSTYYGFDNTLSAMLLIITISTFENWAEAMTIAARNSGLITFLYFFVLIILCSYLIPNLIIATISYEFTRARNRADEFRRQKIDRIRHVLKQRRNIAYIQKTRPILMLQEKKRQDGIVERKLLQEQEYQHIQANLLSESSSVAGMMGMMPHNRKNDKREGDDENNNNVAAVQGSEKNSSSNNTGSAPSTVNKKKKVVHHVGFAVDIAVEASNTNDQNQNNNANLNQATTENDKSASSTPPPLIQFSFDADAAESKETGATTNSVKQQKKPKKHVGIVSPTSEARQKQEKMSVASALKSNINNNNDDDDDHENNENNNANNDQVPASPAHSLDEASNDSLYEGDDGTERAKNNANKEKNKKNVGMLLDVNNFNSNNHNDQSNMLGASFTSLPSMSNTSNRAAILSTVGTSTMENNYDQNGGEENKKLENNQENSGPFSNNNDNNNNNPQQIRNGENANGGDANGRNQKDNNNDDDEDDNDEDEDPRSWTEKIFGSLFVGWVALRDLAYRITHGSQRIHDDGGFCGFGRVWGGGRGGAASTAGRTVSAGSHSQSGFGGRFPHQIEDIDDEDDEDDEENRNHHRHHRDSRRQSWQEELTEASAALSDELNDEMNHHDHQKKNKDNSNNNNNNNDGGGGGAGDDNNKSKKSKSLTGTALEQEEAIVTGTWFSRFVLLVILLNTVVLAMRHANQPAWVDDVETVSNEVFTIIFLVEMVLMLLALGFRGYAKDPFNIFDGVVVIVAVVELFATGSTLSSVFRAFRLLRILKLVRQFPTLRVITRVMFQAVHESMYLLLLVGLYLFMMALIGEALFGGKIDSETKAGNLKRPIGDDLSFTPLSFKNFLDAWYAAFEILSLDEWTVTMYHIMDVTSAAAALFFVIDIIIGYYLLQNLFLSVLIFAFKSIDTQEEAKRSRALLAEDTTIEKGFGEHAIEFKYEEGREILRLAAKAGMRHMHGHPSCTLTRHDPESIEERLQHRKKETKTFREHHLLHFGSQPSSHVEEYAHREIGGPKHHGHVDFDYGENIHHWLQADQEDTEKLAQATHRRFKVGGSDSSSVETSSSSSSERNVEEEQVEELQSQILPMPTSMFSPVSTVRRSSSKMNLMKNDREQQQKIQEQEKEQEKSEEMKRAAQQKAEAEKEKKRIEKRQRTAIVQEQRKRERLRKIKAFSIPDAIQRRRDGFRRRNREFSDYERENAFASVAESVASASFLVPTFSNLNTKHQLQNILPSSKTTASQLSATASKTADPTAAVEEEAFGLCDEVGPSVADNFFPKSRQLQKTLALVRLSDKMTHARNDSLNHHNFTFTNGGGAASFRREATGNSFSHGGAGGFFGAGGGSTMNALGNTLTMNRSSSVFHYNRQGSNSQYHFYNNNNNNNSSPHVVHSSKRAALAASAAALTAESSASYNRQNSSNYDNLNNANQASSTSNVIVIPSSLNSEALARYNATQKHHRSSTTTDSRNQHMSSRQYAHVVSWVDHAIRHAEGKSEEGIKTTKKKVKVIFKKQQKMLSDLKQEKQQQQQHNLLNSASGSFRKNHPYPYQVLGKNMSTTSFEALDLHNNNHHNNSGSVAGAAVAAENENNNNNKTATPSSKESPASNNTPQAKTFTFSTTPQIKDINISDSTDHNNNHNNAGALTLLNLKRTNSTILPNPMRSGSFQNLLLLQQKQKHQQTMIALMHPKTGEQYQQLLVQEKVNRREMRRLKRLTSTNNNKNRNDDDDDNNRNGDSLSDTDDDVDGDDDENEEADIEDSSQDSADLENYVFSFGGEDEMSSQQNGSGEHTKKKKNRKNDKKNKANKKKERARAARKKKAMTLSLGLSSGQLVDSDEEISKGNAAENDDGDNDENDFDNSHLGSDAKADSEVDVLQYQFLNERTGTPREGHLNNGNDDDDDQNKNIGGSKRKSNRKSSSRGRNNNNNKSKNQNKGKSNNNNNNKKGKNNRQVATQRGTTTAGVGTRRRLDQLRFPPLILKAHPAAPPDPLPRERKHVCLRCDGFVENVLPAPTLVIPRTRQNVHQSHCDKIAIRRAKEELLREMLELARWYSRNWFCRFSAEAMSKEGQLLLNGRGKLWRIVDEMVTHCWSSGMLLAVHPSDVLSATDPWEFLIGELEEQHLVLNLHVGEDVIGLSALAIGEAGIRPKNAFRFGYRAEATMDDETKEAFKHSSLFIFSPDNWFRQLCQIISASHEFEMFILASIIISGIIMAFDSPLLDDHEPRKIIAEKVGLAFTILFLVEIVLRTVAVGFVLHPGSYCRDPWNTFDGLIVVLAAFSKFFADAIALSSVGVFKIFHGLRAVRPLRVIRRNRGLKMVVRILGRSLSGVMNVAIIIFIVVFIFAILGIQLFSGQFKECSDPSINALENCTGDWFDPHSYNTSVMVPRIWRSESRNFDNIFQALLTSYEISTGDALLDVFTRALYGCSEIYSTVETCDRSTGLFFVAFFAISGFFLKQLFVGVVVHNYHFVKEQLDGSSTITDPEQKRWISFQAFLFHYRPVLPMVHDESDSTSAWLFKNVVSKSWFEPVVNFTILLNVLMVAVDFHDIPLELDASLEICNYFFVVFYFLEALVKILTFKERYFSTTWNQFDFLLMLLGVAGVAVTFNIFFAAASSGTITLRDVAASGNVSFGALRAFRLLRMLRMLRVARGAKKFQTILETIWLSLPTLANTGAFLILANFVFAVLAVDLFAQVYIPPFANVLDNQFSNFRQFDFAMMLLFRFQTRQDWVGAMRDLMITAPDCSDTEGNCGTPFAPVFFVAYLLITSYIMVNLFTAMLLDVYETVRSSEDGAALQVSDITKFVTEWSHLADKRLRQEETTRKNLALQQKQQEQEKEARERRNSGNNNPSNNNNQNNNNHSHFLALISSASDTPENSSTNNHHAQNGHSSSSRESSSHPQNDNNNNNKNNSHEEAVGNNMIDVPASPLSPTTIRSNNAQAIEEKRRISAGKAIDEILSEDPLSLLRTSDFPRLFTRLFPTSRRRDLFRAMSRLNIPEHGGYIHFMECLITLSRMSILSSVPQESNFYKSYQHSSEIAANNNNNNNNNNRATIVMAASASTRHHPKSGVASSKASAAAAAASSYNTSPSLKGLAGDNMKKMDGVEVGDLGSTINQQIQKSLERTAQLYHTQDNPMLYSQKISHNHLVHPLAWEHNNNHNKPVFHSSSPQQQSLNHSSNNQNHKNNSNNNNQQHSPARRKSSFNIDHGRYDDDEPLFSNVKDEVPRKEREEWAQWKISLPELEDLPIVNVNERGATVGHFFAATMIISNYRGLLARRTANKRRQEKKELIENFLKGSTTTTRSSNQKDSLRQNELEQQQEEKQIGERSGMIVVVEEQKPNPKLVDAAEFFE